MTIYGNIDGAFAEVTVIDVAELTNVEASVTAVVAFAKALKY
jgi:hypothetical protein